MISQEFHLLSDPYTTGNNPYRPPWALAEHPFLQVCGRCDACIDACPEHILTHGRGGFPVIDFAVGGCTFCGKCTEACERGGLHAPDTHPWHQKAFIAATCQANHGTACQACGDACPAGAINFRAQLGGTPVPILEEMWCTGCGACVSACPSRAVSVFNLI